MFKALLRTWVYGHTGSFGDLTSRSHAGHTTPAANHPPEVHQRAENALDKSDEQHVKHGIVLKGERLVHVLLTRPHNVSRYGKEGQHGSRGKRHSHCACATHY